MNEENILDWSSVEDIALLDDNYRNNNFDTYFYNGIGVPRVSNILKECINKEYLIKWAGRVGIKEMEAQQTKACTIGSMVHEKIENFLLTGTDKNVSYKVPKDYNQYIEKAYNNFKNWYNNLHSMGYVIEQIYATEKQVICPYFGGTIDCVMRINGKNYIVDFKTSKSISHEYIIQTCSYMWIVNNGYCPDLPHIDGVAIIRVDKNTDKFEDLFLNENINNQRHIIEQYMVGFGALLKSFYNNINMKLLYSQYKKEYNIYDTLEGYDG